MSAERKRRRRERLWKKQRGLCHWCSGEMTLEWPTHRGSRLPDNAATIEHLHDRFSPMRLVPARGERRWVLACRKCNHERGMASQAEQPLNELWRRSGREPVSATLGDVWPT